MRGMGLYIVTQNLRGKKHCLVFTQFLQSNFFSKLLSMRSFGQIACVDENGNDMNEQLTRWIRAMWDNWCN